MCWVLPQRSDIFIIVLSQQLPYCKGKCKKSKCINSSVFVAQNLCDKEQQLIWAKNRKYLCIIMNEAFEECVIFWKGYSRTYFQSVTRAVKEQFRIIFIFLGRSIPICSWSVSGNSCGIACSGGCWFSSFTVSYLQFDYNSQFGDWSKETRGAPLICPKPLDNWLLVYTRRNYDTADTLLQNLFKVTPAMGIKMNKATM